MLTSSPTTTVDVKSNGWSWTSGSPIASSGVHTWRREVLRSSSHRPRTPMSCMRHGWSTACSRTSRTCTWYRASEPSAGRLSAVDEHSFAGAVDAPPPERERVPGHHILDGKERDRWDKPLTGQGRVDHGRRRRDRAGRPAPGSPHDGATVVIGRAETALFDAPRAIHEVRRRRRDTWKSSSATRSRRPGTSRRSSAAATLADRFAIAVTSSVAADDAAPDVRAAGRRWTICSATSSRRSS